MTLSISLSSEAEAKLKERAAATGKDPAAYAAEIVEQAVAKPTIDELLAPVREDFAKTGMTEAQMMDFGRDLVRKARKEKKA